MNNDVKNKIDEEICGVASRGLATMLKGDVSAVAADRVREAARNHARAVRMRRTWKRLATGVTATAASLAIILSAALHTDRGGPQEVDLETCMALVALSTVVTEYNGAANDSIESAIGSAPAEEEYVVDFESLADRLLLMQDSALVFDDYYALSY